MPNFVQNRIVIKAKGDRLDEILSFIKEKGEVDAPLLIDFSNIIPYPEYIFTDNVSDDMERVLEHYGVPYLYKWRRENWGTKWNALRTEIKNGNEVWFETAWHAVPLILESLSETFRHTEFEYTWSDEDAGNNVGKATYKNGETASEYRPAEGEKEAMDIYLELHEFDRKRWLLAGDEYVYIDE